MKIFIVTDAYYPQTNGVVTTMSNVINCLQQMGHIIKVISPNDVKTLPFKPYPDVQLASFCYNYISSQLDQFKPDMIHIVTEFSLGIQASIACKNKKLSYTTSYHTKFPEYMSQHWHIPSFLGYQLLKAFHNSGDKTLVATKSLYQHLQQKGFKNLVLWNRGVDTNIFRPLPPNIHTVRPNLFYIGRVSYEKNIEAFLSIDIPGTKWVVGDGPAKNKLQKKYPNVIFTGNKYNTELAQMYSNADVTVFPSLTDTFGMVILESLACGTPVAAFPVTGPIDIIQDGITGGLGQNLKEAIYKAMLCKRHNCIEYAKKHTWMHCTDTFINNLIKV